MFDIIADVRSYPVFLNGCEGAKIIRENEGQVVASLTISYGRLNFSFTTCNSMIVNESVVMTLVDGPFSKLHGQWLIQRLGDTASKVSLDMEFVFKNAITQKLFGRVFQNVVSSQFEAFQKRAVQLYGGEHA
jgi:ribosome-associated toxin RatA of RatAB toxin-antitoxin module